MNKVLLAVVVAVVLVAALGTAVFVYAQTSTPQAPATGSGYGYGMSGGRGMTPAQARGAGVNQGAGRGYNAGGVEPGILHDGMISYYAEKLDLTVDQINTRLANGETMAQIAYSTGLTSAQFQTLMLDARTQAIEQAVSAGTLTQTQADAMQQRGAGMMSGGRGMRSAGQGQFANPNCPYYQTNP